MDSSMGQATGPPVRILSIDGGGVRGLSSLLILERIMERMKQLENLPELPKPCDRFDFIGGTGTGGIIAIMLGRLKMTAHESIQAYKKLSETGFYEKRTRLKRSQCPFSAKKLEAAIKLAIRENCCESPSVEQRKDKSIPTTKTCTHDDMLFYEETCVKTAVLAITKTNVNTLPTIFKTYLEPTTGLAECRVWQVARATSAAVGFFKPIKLGRDRIEFIDALFGNNNPCETLIKEAEKLFPHRRTITLSLGTGLGDVIEISNLQSSITSAFEKMATSSKGTHQRLKDRYTGTNNYHRLNVISGLMDVTLLDSRSFSKIAGLTKSYLDENDELVTAYVKALATNAESDQTDSQHNYEMDENDKQCLSDLCATDPSTDKVQIQSTKGGLLRDSYQWILSHNSFKQFRNGTESQILWIKGDPGKGKTMLLCGIIDELVLEESVTLSYFFCQATNNRLNTATSVLRGLIYHLANCNPQLIKHVREKYDRKKNLIKNEAPWHDLCEILTAMVNDPSLSNLILIIDGLDECSVDRPNLLEFITKPSPAKWIVSSRNWPDIEETLNNAEQKVKIHLELNQDSVSAAVDSYINFKVDELVQKKDYDNNTKMAILKYLKANSNGTFLWVALVYHELSNAKARKRHILDTLKSLPPGLDALYQRMLINISEFKDAQFCKDIVAYALVVYRPITLEELHVLVEGLEDMETKEVEEIIASCGSFLTVHDNAISFVHQSAKDYLLKEALDEILPSGILRQHRRVFLRSLDILYKRLQRNIYKLQPLGCSIDHDQVPVPDPDPLAAIGYFCIFWADHLCDCDLAADDMININDEILTFFKEKYLQWLEAISLLRSIPSAGKVMYKLTPFLQEKASQDLREIVKDAQRFLLSHGEAIELAPLQVYVSALIFSPAKSLIRKMYSHEEPDWIEPKPRVEENWDVCLRTLEGHVGAVYSVAFSNDGQRLASGSRDSTVKIWDATSGACLQTLEGHDNAVTSVVFSNDEQRLASGSWDKTVKIWDATSGACLQTLEGHGDTVFSVVFSNDGQRLASGSRDSTVKIWDATSGACLRTLEGHGGWVNSVVFSNDGQRLASGSSDSTVKIWDATSGACLQTLEGHDGTVFSVVFSNYGQRLASGSSDKTVKIWDATSGACLQTLEGHGNWVNSVVFSNDGQRLASGSSDKTVKIWDATSGACLQTLEGHGGSVYSVAFSNDGQRLASGSFDNTVKIWDATSGACLQTLEGHDGWVNLVVFSNDGQRLASGSFDKTVKIWDATSGACLQTLEGHDNAVFSVVFSNDGQRLASGSSDSTVKIWDATSGACLQTLEGHGSWVNSVVFSNDGQRLASESGDKTVKIWDATSGACLQIIEGHGKVDPMVFLNTEQQSSSAPLADQTSLLSSQSYSYSISRDRVWISQNQQRVLWLPPSCRPGISAFSSNKIGLCSSSGRVTIIGFKSTSHH